MLRVVANGTVVSLRLKDCGVLALYMLLPTISIGVLFGLAIVTRTGLISRWVGSGGGVLSSAAVSRRLVLVNFGIAVKHAQNY